MNHLPRPCLVDTNVPVVANGHSPQAGDDLVEKCIDVLLEITNAGGLVIDSEGRIFEEYRQNLNLSGQPGTGDLFMKWVQDHQWIPELCERRDVTCLDEAEQEFAEFPATDTLEDFDRGDRKFVAVANAGEPKRPILEAVDFKWWGWRQALQTVGIQVVFVDEASAEAGYRKHLGNG
jgi:hypothetical protein